jgi:hypothetical protein
MIRFILALSAIVVLALSASLTPAHLPTSHSPAASALQAIDPKPALAMEIGLASGQPARRAARQATEDAPEPALIAYLALVLIGSIVAVGFVRRSAGREG